MNKSFSRFTLPAYMLLMVAFFTTVTAGLGIIPAISITLSMLILDLATGPKSTLIYGLVGIFAVSIFDLYTWVRDRIIPNLQKEQMFRETNKNNFNKPLSSVNKLEIVTDNLSLSSSPSSSFFPKENSQQNFKPKTQEPERNLKLNK